MIGENLLTNQELPENKTQCDTLNRSYTKFHHYKYGGVPEAIILNCIGTSLLIILFSFLRRRAGNYARLALNHKTWNCRFSEPKNPPNALSAVCPISIDVQLNREDASFHCIDDENIEDEKIVQQMFQETHDEKHGSAENVNKEANDVNHCHGDLLGNNINNNNNNTNHIQETSPKKQKETKKKKERSIDEGFFSWISDTIRLSDAQYREAIGPDAVQYLLFQRYLICVICIICAISSLVILPVNLFLGDNLDSTSDTYPLAFTTISNLKTDSIFLWVPATISILYIIIILLLMRHFTANMPFKSQFRTSAIMITDITTSPHDISILTADNIKQCFNILYPDIHTEVTLAYNVQKLARYLKKLEYLSVALEFCDDYNSLVSERLMMSPKKFGVLFSCLPSCMYVKVDAQEYYQGRVHLLQEKVDRERNNIQNNPLGVAFVAFQSRAIARKVCEDFKTGTNGAKLRRHVPDIGADYWSVKMSPPKNDVVWENLQNIGPRSFLRGCLVNFMYVILFIFVSSPAVLLTWFETVDKNTAALQDKARDHSVFGLIVPPLLFVSVAVFMPYLIFQLDDLRSHWKLSTLNLRVMTKTYIYLLFMVVILPSVGLTSIYKFIDAVLIQNDKLQWECIFLIDNGAFFTNYVITAGMGGLCMELLRVCDLLLYVCRLVIMRSKAEQQAAIKNTLLEFPYGFMYAYQLTVMSVVIVYSITCPLITPFGVVYMLLRHFVDRYNIYFSYSPSKISETCHYRAVYFLILASIVMLIALITFCLVRQKGDGIRGYTIFLIICASCIVVLLFARRTFGVLKSFSPFVHDAAINSDTECNAETKNLDYDNQDAEQCKFDCPYLTFTPTWLCRQATPTPRSSFKNSNNALMVGAGLTTGSSTNRSTEYIQVNTHCEEQGSHPQRVTSSEKKQIVLSLNDVSGSMEI